MRLEIGKNIEKDDELCRYFSFESFVNLIEKNMLTFTRVSMWEDPWENELSSYKVRSNGEVKDPEYGADRYFFGQCWTEKVESDAMWRIYSPNKSGVKIKTKVGNLEAISNTKRIGVEKVVYFSKWQELKELTENDSSPYQNVKYKRSAFSHEEEVRFIIHPQYTTDSIDYHDSSHINLPVKLSNFIEEIEIDPRAPIWIEAMIKAYSQRTLPNIKCGKSSLYDKNEEFQIIHEFVPVEK
jgi:hypothetical protein